MRTYLNCTGFTSLGLDQDSLRLLVVRCRRGTTEIYVRNQPELDEMTSYASLWLFVIVNVVDASAVTSATAGIATLTETEAPKAREDSPGDPRRECYPRKQ